MRQVCNNSFKVKVCPGASKNLQKAAYNALILVLFPLMMLDDCVLKGHLTLVIQKNSKSEGILSETSMLLTFIAVVICDCIGLRSSKYV